MKKYVKPDVAFEGFELSRHIAGGCDYRMNHSDVTSCFVEEAIGAGTFIPQPGQFAHNGACLLPTDENYCLYNGVNGAMVLMIS